MKITREWAMPNKNTFSILPIKRLLERRISSGVISIDAFANESKIARFTNDLNPIYDTDHHLDAVDFFKLFYDNSVDIVLYDPPYSLRQVSECYKNVGIPVTMETTQSSWRRKHLDEIARITKLGGYVISFGWNSQGFGKNLGFEIIEILLVPHGRGHNDTIVVVERKLTEKIF